MKKDNECATNSPVCGIINSIRVAAKSIAPGLLETLNLYCILKGGLNVFDALYLRPELIVQALNDIYRNKEAVLFIAREVLIKPVAQSLRVNANVNSLVDLFVRRPEEFKKMLTSRVAAQSR